AGAQRRGSADRPAAVPAGSPGAGGVHPRRATSTGDADGRFPQLTLLWSGGRAATRVLGMRTGLASTLHRAYIGHVPGMCRVSVATSVGRDERVLAAATVS